MNELGKALTIASCGMAVALAWDFWTAAAGATHAARHVLGAAGLG